jgi:GT2 family glycosyltransferase
MKSLARPIDGELNPADYSPVRILEIDLDQPLSAITGYDPRTQRTYRTVRLLVRLHTHPMGVIDVDLDASGLSAAESATLIWAKLGAAINEHLRQDRLQPIASLAELRSSTGDMPLCLHTRANVLVQAPFVSVVVCTRDRVDKLAACLPSLLALHYPHYEVIVVDNAPRTTATADLIAGRYGAHPNLRYVREDMPGLSAGRNRGISIARGEIIAITDDDVVVDRHWLSEIVTGFQHNPAIACVTGPIYAYELETPAQILIEEFGAFNRGFTPRIFDLNEYRPDSPLFPYSAGIFGSGANISFRATVLRDLGAFDPALGAGSLALSGEEFAIFVQLLRHGYQIAYMPGAFIYHYHHREYAVLRRQIYGYAVGLTAYLTKCILDNPVLLLDILRKIPAGIWYLLNPHSAKNRKKGTSYPRELNRLELLGLAYGPFAYLRSRFRVARRQTRLSPPTRRHRSA